MTQPVEIIDAVLPAVRVLNDDPAVLVAFVYGSAARNRLRPDSDIDFAVAGNAPFDAARLMDLIHRLSGAVHREVDVIDLNRTKGLVFYEALTKGKRLVVKDTVLLARFMTEAVYYHADFLPLVRACLDERVRRFSHG